MIKYRESIEFTELTIGVLNLSIRTYNNLKRSGINTLEDLLKKSIDDLSKIRNLNKKCLDEIVRELNKYGLKIKNQNNHLDCSKKEKEELKWMK